MIFHENVGEASKQKVTEGYGYDALGTQGKPGVDALVGGRENEGDITGLQPK